jgi:hypothetical protein
VEEEEQVIIAELLKIFPGFYETGRFIIFSPHQCTLS